MTDSDDVPRFATEDGDVTVITRRQLLDLPEWKSAFAGRRKDWRYYQIVEETIPQDFDYRYFVLHDRDGAVRAIQPFFLLRQDLLQGAGPRVQAWVGRARRCLPGLLTMRTLMLGCAAGEGHLDPADPERGTVAARQLHRVLVRWARKQRVSMVVLKEFPASYRAILAPFRNNGYTRVPSMPGVRIAIGFDSFERYLASLSKATRKDLRRKFRDTEDAGITMQVLTDITPIVEELYPLYLQVFERSSLRFEKLTPGYLRLLGERMPDRVRFFVWRRSGRAIAFSVCMIQNDEIHDEYMGLDYAVALDLHLYFHTLRDVMQWAMENGFRWYCSTALGYEPKRRLNATLAPLDLYVAHTWPGVNGILRRVLPLLEPTRGDPHLRTFPNFADLRGDS